MVWSGFFFMSTIAFNIMYLEYFWILEYQIKYYYILFYLDIIHCLLLILHHLQKFKNSESHYVLQTGQPGFVPTRGKDFSYSLCVLTIFQAHPAYYPMGTGGLYPRGKHGQGVTLTTDARI
jgi:hypothetical protein